MVQLTKYRICQWRKYGKRFGYPECCINDFLCRMSDYTNIKLPSRIQIKVSKHSGFVPCSYCCWKILTKKCNLEDLITDRKQRTMFPEGTKNYY